MRKLKKQPKAVLFDMDGVIVDSMPYHFLAWYEALRPFGVRISCFDVYYKEGERWDKSLKDFLNRENIHPSKEILKKIFANRQKIFKSHFERSIFKGAEELLRCLKKKGYLLGLVTGTPMQDLNGILPKRIKSLFDCLITGDKVKHGKPHPEPYLKAAQVLGVTPKDCVVIENAPLGIRSAKSAGMFCIAVTTSLPKNYLKRADIVVDKLEDISGIIESSCGI